MPEFLLIDAKPYHCGRMARALRKEHRDAILACGVPCGNIHRALRAAFAQSRICKAWFIDGDLVALGGIVGGLLDREAQVWVALSEGASKFPLATFREARRQLSALMPAWQRPVSYLLPSDFTARRFARMLSFQEQPNPDIPLIYAEAA